MDFKLTVNLGEPTLAVLSQLVQAIHALADERPISVQPVVVPYERPRFAQVIVGAGGTGQMPGTQDGVTPGNAARSAVVAAASPTAPEAPAAGLPLPPTAAASPASPSEPAADATDAAAGPAPAVDSAGLPWDGRIHSESKALIADGTWRKRRNTAPELVAQVEAELRALAAPADVPAPPASATPLPPTASAPVPVPPAPAPASTPEPTGAAAPAAAAGDFESFFKPYVDAMQIGKINSQMVNDALTELAIPTVMVLKQRPELIPSFKALLGLD